VAVFFLRRQLLTALMVLCVSTLVARDEVKVGSTRPVASPDGARNAVVDHIMPVVDGEPDRFSGRMAIRVTDTDGTATKRRLVETSQVSVIQSPRWLGADLVAFFYNIKKNANGIVYFDTATGEAVQLEFVGTVRRMGATNTVATELTSIEVAVYGEAEEPERVSTVVHAGGAVFPLFLKPLPAFENEPFPVTVLEDIRAAVAAQRKFLARHKMADLQVEVGSESFSPDNRHVAMLACADGKSAMLIVPLEAQPADAALSATLVASLEKDVELNCALAASPQLTMDTDQSGPGPGEFGGYRFTTKWTSPESVQVVREIFETEEDPTRREPFYEVDLNGAVRKLERAPAPSSQADKPRAEKGNKAAPAKALAPAAPATARAETRPAASAAAPARATAAVRREPPTPPTPVAAPEEPPKGRLQMLRKLIPGEKSPPTDTPAPGR
jgi:hypothetical protein